MTGAQQLKMREIVTSRLVSSEQVLGCHQVEVDLTDFVFGESAAGNNWARGHYTTPRVSFVYLAVS